MKKLRLILIICTVAMVAVVSCSKKGDAGPAGPAGPTGATGPAGGTGPAGIDSVLYSTWAPLDLTGDVSGTDSVYYQAIAASAITQAVLDNGLILTYVQDGIGSVYPSGDVGIFASFSLGSVDVITGQNYTGIPFRYVVVPGTISTNGYSFAQLKKMSYADVMKALGKKAVVY